MKHRWLACLLSLLIAVLSTTPLFSQNERPSISVSFVPSIAPNMLLDEQGNRTGFYTELIEQIASLHDFTINFVDGSWSDNFEKGRAGEIDLLVAVRYTDERRQFLDFVEESVINSWSVVITHLDRSLESTFDLEDLRVGLMTGDQNAEAFKSYIRSFDISVEEVPFESFDQISQAIESKSIDAGIVFSNYSVPPGSQTKKSNIVFNPSGSSFATSKGNIPEVIRIIENQLREWKDDRNSFYYALVDRWFGTYFEAPTEIPEWIYYIMATVAATYLLTLILIRILTRKVKKTNSELADLNQTLEYKVQERTKRLEQSQKRLIQSEKMAGISRMVSSLAHEINNPIGVAMTAASFINEEALGLLRDKHSDNLTEERFNSSLQKITESGSLLINNIERANKLVGSFKEISRDQQVQEVRKIDLSDYIHTVITSLSPQIRKSNISVTVAVFDIQLSITPDTIGHIITNFISNSITHGFEIDQKDKTIFISAERKDKSINFIYEDNGKGVSDGVVENIFEPFYTTNREEGSTGMGLNIIYNLVKDQLCGDIVYEKNEPRGARFVINFPDLDYVTNI